MILLNEVGWWIELFVLEFNDKCICFEVIVVVELFDDFFGILLWF